MIKTIGVILQMREDGGASRSRTGLNGFAGHGITALLSRLRNT